LLRAGRRGLDPCAVLEPVIAVDHDLLVARQAALDQGAAAERLAENLVAGGSDQFGQAGGSESLLASRDKGLPVVGLAMLFLLWRGYI